MFLKNKQANKGIEVSGAMKRFTWKNTIVIFLCKLVYYKVLGLTGNCNGKNISDTKIG